MYLTPIILLLSSAQAANAVHVENLPLAAMSQDWGTPQKDKSVDGHYLSVGKKRFEHGIGTHANSQYLLDLHGKAVKFTAQVGLDDESTPRGSVVFRLVADGKVVAESPIMRKGTEAASLEADLTHVKRLSMVVNDAGDGNDNDHGDWLNPTITVQPGSGNQIQPYEPPPEPMPIIAHGTGPRPMINGPRTLGCTAGHDFIWRIPASGQGPLKFAASNLPDGLSLDSTTGIISGKVTDPGVAQVQLSVTGPKGADTRTVSIDSRGQLALTPPMGWNSWNVWGTSVTAAKVRAAAKAFETSGLANYGYSTVNIDDAWEGPRGPDGIITTNEKFGDMKALADSVHAMGLHLGIYSSPGPTTCAGYPASYKFEKEDADTYAKWGIDYLKYDWCSYGEIAPNPDADALKKPYILMSRMLKDSGHDITFSLCQYGMGDVWNWGRSVGGNLWRCTGDINDSWGSMSTIGFSGSKWATGAGPGAWNDPDMLVVGNLGWGDHPHPTRLTPNEQVTHITLWSLLAAPLLIGCDLTNLSPFTFDLLTNHDVIDVDQDPLGHPAQLLGKDGTTEVWARVLAGGSYGVGLFNRGEDPAPVTVKWSDLQLEGKHRVRDLWRMKELGAKADHFTVKVARHGAVLIKIS